MQLGFSRAEGKASVQSFGPTAEPGQGEHEASCSPSVRCEGPAWPWATWANAGEPRARTLPLHKSPDGTRERTSFFSRLNITHLPELAVATLTLASDLFPGVTDGQARSLSHLDPTGHESIVPLSSPVPQDLRGMDWWPRGV